MSKKDKLKAGTVVDDPFGESQPPAAATTLKAGTIVEDPFVEPASFQQAPKPASTPSGAATGPSTPSPSPLEEPLPMFMDLPWASQGQSSASPPSRLASQQEPLPVDGSMGLRLDGAPKGNGYLGPIKAKDGSVMTELSFDFEADGKKVFAPLLVPTLSQSEVDLLASGADHTPAIIRKAEDHALQRIAQGKSPFAGKDDPITGVNKDLLDDDQRARLQKDLDALRRSAAMSKTGFMPAQADAIADKLEKDRLARQPKVEPDYAKQVLDEYGMEVPEGMDPKTYKQGLDSEYKSRFAAMDLATAQRTKQASAERLKRLDASMQALAGRMKQVNDAYAKFPEWSATADPEEARRELSLMENTGKQTQASMEAYQDLARSALRDMQLSVLREYDVKKGTGSWAGAMGLSIPKGVGSVAAGAQSFVIDALAAMLPKDAVVPKGETGTRDEAAKILKRLMLPGTRASYANAVRDLTGIKTTDEYYADQQENGNIVTRSLLGLGESVPGMVTPGMFGIFLQSADAVGKELEGEEYDDISEGEKAAMKTLIAVPQMALERFGFRNLVKNTAVSKGIVARVLRKMAPGASAGQIQRLIDAETRSVIGNAVSRGFGATASEVETGVMQEGVDVGIRSLYNLAKGKRVLDQPDNLYDATVQIAESGVMEGIGGGVLGAPAAIGSAMRTGKVARDMDVRQYEMFEGLLKDPEYASAVSDWNNALVEAKKITEAEKVKRENDLAQASEIAAQIPENLPVEARRDAYDLLVEKRKLKMSDPALSGPRIAEIDAKLAKLSGATKEDTGAEKAKSEDTKGTETKENAPTPPPEQKVEGEVKPTAPATAQVPQGQAPATGTTAVQKDELDDLLGEVPKADGNEQRTTDEEAGGGAAIEGAGTGTGAQVAQATGDAQDAGVPLAQQQGGGGVAAATETGAKEVGAEAPREAKPGTGDGITTPYLTKNGKHRVTYDPDTGNVVVEAVEKPKDTWSGLPKALARKERKKAKWRESRAKNRAREEFVKATGIKVGPKPNKLKDAKKWADEVLRKVGNVSDGDLGLTGAVLRYFANGGRLALDKGGESNRSRDHLGMRNVWDPKTDKEVKSSEEKKAAWLIDEKDGRSVDEIAHRIWEQWDEGFIGGDAEANRPDIRDVANAVHEVIRGGYQSKTDAIEALSDMIPESLEDRERRLEDEYMRSRMEAVSDEDMAEAEYWASEAGTDELELSWAQYQEALKQEHNGTEDHGTAEGQGDTVDGQVLQGREAGLRAGEADAGTAQGAGAGEETGGEVRGQAQGEQAGQGAGQARGRVGEDADGGVEPSLPDGRKAWQVTRDEWHDEHLEDVDLRRQYAGRTDRIPGMPEHPDDVHERAVRSAVARGENVPQEVINNYDDLAKEDRGITEQRTSPQPASKADNADFIRNRKPITYRVLKALEGIGGVRVYYPRTARQYSEMVSRLKGQGLTSQSSWGVFSPANKVIVINPNGPDLKQTLFHEAAHPIVAALMHSRPDLFTKFYEQVLKEEGGKYAKFAEKYKDRSPEQQAQEAIVEFLADVAAGKVPVRTTKDSLWQRFKAWVQEVLAAMGWDMRRVDLGNPKDVRDLAARLSKAFNEGIRVSGLDGSNVDTVLKDGASLSEQRSGIPAVAKALVDRGITDPAAIEQELTRRGRPDLVREVQEEVAAQMKGQGGTDPYSMSDADLEDFLAKKFGRRSGSSGMFSARRGQKYIFRDEAHFDQWMLDRFNEHDLEGMQEAFAEADAKDKVGYVRRVQRSGNQDLRDWVAHIATGAPLPPGYPPIQRTTPRPMPQGGTSGGQGGGTGGGGTTVSPKPKARGKRGMDIMAMVQMLNELGHLPPVINTKLKSALGRYKHVKNVVELRKRLLWDKRLAEEVLAHEIGHLVDFAIEQSGKSKDFADRIAPYRQFKKDVADALKESAKDLSAKWRGPFDAKDKYRNSSKELVADFLSAMFNNPEWVEANYKDLYDAFNDMLAAKPRFNEVYEEVMSRISGDRVVDEWAKQQDKEHDEGIEKLMSLQDKKGESIRGALQGLFRSPWYHIRRIQGKKMSRDLARSMQDDLELTNIFSQKENALYESDYMEKVVPLLKQVGDDSGKVMKLLHQYTQANRTINERRAAGKWIEDNPNEARQMLAEVAKLFPETRPYLNDIAAARQDELYDLAAQMFREVHDGAAGKSKAEKEERLMTAATKVDELNLGVKGDAMLIAFNVRGNILNPGGLTPETAAKRIEGIRTQLGDEKFEALSKAQKAVSNLLFEIQTKAYQEGLISDGAYKEVILPNKDNYAPYAVLDHFFGRVGAGMAQQYGGAGAILDVTLASQIKVAAINRWRQRQHITKTLIDAYANAGLSVDTSERLERASDIDHVRAKHRHDTNSRLVFYRNGTPFIAVFASDPGKTFELATQSENIYQSIAYFHKFGSLAQAPMEIFTVFSPSFWARNVIRGARTSINRIGTRNVARTFSNVKRQKEALRLAANYAMAAHGQPLLPEVRELIDKGFIPPPRLSYFRSHDAAMQRHLMAGGLLMAYHVGTPAGKPSLWERYKGLIGINKIANVAATYEAYEKIMNYYAASSRKDLNERAARGVTIRSGIPKPGVGGRSRTLNLVIETLFPFTRVSMQGELASYDILRDPKMGKGYAARLMFYELLPRIISASAGVGLVSKLMSGDDDDDDKGIIGVFGEAVRRASPYKMAMDVTIPVAFYDPRTGTYHGMNEIDSPKKIPEHWEAVSLRIPSSEEGRIWGVLAYNMMTSHSDQLGKPGRGVVGVASNWATEVALPGFNPFIELARDAGSMVLSGKNPDDSFTGAPVANPLLFDSGWDGYRGQAISGGVLQRLGFAGQTIGQGLVASGVLDPRAMKSSSKRSSSAQTPVAELIPAASSLVSYDNSYMLRKERLDKVRSEEARAQAKAFMSLEVKEMFDFYYRNRSREDKLDKHDKVRYIAAKHFVNNIWGKAINADGDTLSVVQTHLTKSGEIGIDAPTMYGKVLWAVSNDASKMAKQELKMEIDRIAEPNLKVFTNPTAVLKAFGEDEGDKRP